MPLSAMYFWAILPSFVYFFSTLKRAIGQDCGSCWVTLCYKLRFFLFYSWIEAMVES